MARGRSNFRSRMLERHGRQTFWFSAITTQDTIATASTAIILSQLNAAALALRPFTVVRARGYVHIRPDQESAAESQSIAYGAIVVSDQSVAIGATAVPTPVTDSQSNWFVFEAMADHFAFITGVGFQSNFGRERIVDSKAMRKVTEGQDIITVAETTAVSLGTIVTTFNRMLIKLH